MSQHVDVIVVGGGPAGCATALTLKRAGRSVALIERSLNDKEHSGETLPPAAQPILTRLGLWTRFQAQKQTPSHTIRSCWGQPELYDYDYSFHPYGPWWLLDRKRFDAMLAAEVEAEGGIVNRNSRLRAVIQHDANHWSAEVINGGKSYPLHASFMVDATGRPAFLARRHDARRIVYDSLIGLIAFLPAANETASELYILIEPTSNGWWYSARFPGGSHIAAFMTDADLIIRKRKLLPAVWQAQLKKTRYTRSRLDSLKLKSLPRLVAAHTMRLQSPFGEGWLAVGDASIAFDPLSSQGICHALESGSLAGRVVNSYLAGKRDALEDYANYTKDVFDKYVNLRHYYYGREKRWLNSIFWQRRHRVSSRETVNL